MPAQELWSRVFGRTVSLELREDNAACIQIIKTGKNPATRHMGRTHRVQSAWLHEVFQEPDCILSYQPTDGQASDIFTKAFTDVDKWSSVCGLVGLMGG